MSDSLPHTPSDSCKGTPRILFRDESIFIVEKTAGMHTTAGSGVSLEHQLRRHLPRLAALPDAGLVQRLDFETAGIIAGAFTAQAQTDLSYALSTGKFSKSYLVLAEGVCRSETVVEGYLFSRYRGSAKVSMQAKSKNRAQFSRSMVSTILSTAAVSLVRLECAVARRHQVRVHMASIGHPLLGDALYGSRRSLGEVGLTDYPSAFVLIAATLEFDHPITKAHMRFVSSAASAESLRERLEGCGATI